MNRSKNRGTAWETRVVKYLQDCGWSQVERRTLSGIHDRGDILGLDDWVVECKDAANIRLPEWWRETLTERDNDGAAQGALWIHRRGFSSPADAYVVIDGETFTRLLGEAGY